MALAEFTETLKPLIALLSDLSLENAAETKLLLDEKAPLRGKLVQEIRTAAERGFEEGWLTPKENAGVRFGRIAKDLGGFSVDAVVMSSPGPKHRHGNGEIDLCFSRSGKPQFDGQPEGWVVYPPGSVHVPTVTAGEMLILYFLPKGAIEFLKE